VWWEYIIIAGVLVLGGYCFRVFTRFETQQLSRRSDRSAESIYRNYAGPDGAKAPPRGESGPGRAR
jgi:hypothetical protein